MSDQDPGNQGISVLFEIARTSGLDLNAGQRLELDNLILEGFIAMLSPEGSAGRAKYKVTGKGQRLLDDRGIGANES